jgi:NADH-quinone oxidoreductase subunit L
MDTGRHIPDFGLGMDRLSGIYACFVTFVGLLIHIFATGYMSGDKGFYRFFAYMNLFMFSMLTLVLADNFLLMFVGWEGVGLCSYLLIGYYLKLDEARRAARKFRYEPHWRLGVLIGIFLIFTLTGTMFLTSGRRNAGREAAIFSAKWGETFAWGRLRRRRYSR